MIKLELLGKRNLSIIIIVSHYALTIKPHKYFESSTHHRISGLVPLFQINY